MHDLLLVPGLLGHSGWLLGQEDELLGCSDAGTDFLSAECSVGTAAVRKLPLVLVLVLTLMLVLVILLELLGRVA
jgi:hypothetical protein